MIIKSVDPISLGKILSAMYGAIGLLVGGVLSLVSLVSGAMADSELGAISMLMGMGAVIFMPLFYGFLGFVGGLISALIYNLFSKFVGGVKIEVE